MNNDRQNNGGRREQEQQQEEGRWRRPCQYTEQTNEKNEARRKSSSSSTHSYLVDLATYVAITGDPDSYVIHTQEERKFGQQAQLASAKANGE